MRVAVLLVCRRCPPEQCAWRVELPWWGEGTIRTLCGLQCPGCERSDVYLTPWIFVDGERASA